MVLKDAPYRQVIPVGWDGSLATVSRGVYVDYSGTIAQANTSQEVAPADPERRYFFLQNLSSTIDLYLNFGTDANNSPGSIVVYAGGAIFFDNGVPVESLNLFCTSAGVGFTLKVITDA